MYCKTKHKIQVHFTASNNVTIKAHTTDHSVCTTEFTVGKRSKREHDVNAACVCQHTKVPNVRRKLYIHVKGYT